MFFARLKGARGERRLIFSDARDLAKLDFFTPPTTIDSMSQPYNPEVRLEADEWHHVDLDTEQQESMLNIYVQSEASSADLQTITANDYQDVVALFLVDDGKIAFAKVTDKYRINNRKFLTFEGGPAINEERHAIDFSGNIDAYYDGLGRLYFRSYSTIRPLFSGIEDFFRIATEQEKMEFIAKSLFTNQGLDVSRIGMRASKKIAAIMSDENINLDDHEIQDKYRTYAQNYSESGIEISDEGKFLIKDTRSLDCVLNILGGRYYTSEIFGEKMQSHASSKLLQATAQQT